MSEGKSTKRDSKQRADLDSRNGGVNIKKTPVILVDHTLSHRREMKYLISESKAHTLAQFIKPYLSLDRYCKLQRSGAYPIVSLYLDSENLLLCRESLTGQKNRFKLRIRSYSDDPGYPCFFEIKRRINTIIMKSRTLILQKDIVSALSGMSLPSQDYSTDEEALKQFQLYVKSINARPTVLIRYMRQAFEGHPENRVRVTFDRELCYKVTSEPKIKLKGQGWQRHSYTLGKVILEIKLNVRYPAWLSRMVESFNLQQESISKYATSIKQSCKLGFCAPQLKGINYG